MGFTAENVRKNKLHYFYRAIFAAVIPDAHVHHAPHRRPTYAF